jgi:hypothetical protein
MPSDAAPRLSLAQIIMSKMRTHEEELQQRQQEEDAKTADPTVSYSAHHPKVVSVYKGYKSEQLTQSSPSSCHCH